MCACVHVFMCACVRVSLCACVRVCFCVRSCLRVRTYVRACACLLRAFAPDYRRSQTMPLKAVALKLGGKKSKAHENLREENRRLQNSLCLISIDYIKTHASALHVAHELAQR